MGKLTVVLLMTVGVWLIALALATPSLAEQGMYAAFYVIFQSILLSIFRRFRLVGGA